MLSRSLPVIALFAVAACTTKQARRVDTTSPATATLAGTPSADVAAVRQAIEANDAKFSAAAVQGDSAALAAMYADDAVLMFPNMPAARGREAIGKAFGGMVSAMKVSAVKLETQDVIVAGDYVAETGAFDMTSQAKTKGAKPLHEVGKYLVLWKKQADGSYKILRDIDNDDAPPK